MFTSTLYQNPYQPPSWLSPPPTPFHVYNIDDDGSNNETNSTESSHLYDSDSSSPSTPTSPSPPPSSLSPTPHVDGWTPITSIPFISQASTPHNRRMIIPYECKRGSKRLPPSRDEPLVLYRFFEFHCTHCDQTWLSPLFRAKSGCYCRICHHFVLPRGIRHSFTPYLGKETCYGKYSCHLCNRGWSSYKSMSNCPDKCFECGTLVYPYYQIAHSVLYQKIHKNSCYNTASAFLQSFLNGKSPQDFDGNSHEDSEIRGNLQEQQKRHSRPRKITSISGIHSHSLTKQASTNIKKRLHCLNNVPFLHQQHSAQLRRQIHLKPCFSEPTIGSNGI